MQSNIKSALLVLAGFLVLSYPAMSQDRVVHVYNWSDYIDEEILQEFEAKTGIRVVYDVFDSNDLLETKLLAGNSGYDVVVPGDAFLTRQIQAGVFQKLDKSKLDNWDNLWDLIAQRTDQFDPGNQYAINYMWGTTSFGYNEAKILERMPNAPVNSWRMIFDPEVVSKFADCGVYMVDAGDEMIVSALHYIGEDPDSKDPEVIKKAEAVLKAIRPYISKFTSSEYISALAAGDICLTTGFSGDVFQARARANDAGDGINIKYVIPETGALMWFDMMAIPKDAPHPDEAHAFINHILGAETIAKASNYVYYANGNKASQAYLEPLVLDDPAIYPSEDVMKKLFITTTNPPKIQRLVTRIWSRVKTAQP
ncbi:polyamine ABC transporter substrate-binding protein [Kiloniella laminariae]|uniref:polyamine ABC transporter substrate-binding protein n=1 Tax=Kiloniella laminariae TaxID=454162 RepID=UPI0003A21945|nr:polyamine ABC transporter substrate-binding protein [Kiloniella laminariae]